MQELQRKQQELKQMREAMKTIVVDPTPEERVDRMRTTQALGVDQIFAQQYSTMHNAAAEGTLPAVRHFLDARARLKKNVRDFDIAGKCAIHYAAEHGHNHVITFLLGRGCPVDITSQDGTTSLMYACKMNRLESIALLIESGANLLLKNNAHMTAIHFACANDNRAAVELCLTLYKELKDSIINKGAKKADKEAAAKSKKALKEEAAAEAKAESKAKVAQALAAPPAAAAAAPAPAPAPAPAQNPASTSRKGGLAGFFQSRKEAAEKEASSKQSTTTTAVASTGVTLPPIVAAPAPTASIDDDLDSMGRPKKVGKKEQLRQDMMRLPDNIILELHTLNDLRPLHIAVQYDARDCVAYLLEQKIDIHATDVDGDTALHKAAKFINHVIYRMLVAAGADPNARNLLKETPARLLNWDNTYLG